MSIVRVLLRLASSSGRYFKRLCRACVVIFFIQHRLFVYVSRVCNNRSTDLSICITFSSRSVYTYTSAMHHRWVGSLYTRMLCRLHMLSDSRDPLLHAADLCGHNDPMWAGLPWTPKFHCSKNSLLDPTRSQML